MNDVNSDDLKMDITLDVDISSLELDEKGLNDTTIIPTECECISEVNEAESSNTLRRSKRKRFRPINCENRRSTIKPKKIIDGSYKDTINYYLDKSIKKLPSTLETIFEEPKGDVLMSTRRLKRYISFSEPQIYNKDKLKVKKRVLKAKKIHPFKKLKKVSMDLLMKKLLNMDE